MTEVPVGRKDLLNVITYYFTVLQILFINITIALMRKKIKFLETVKLTERTMFLQNYLVDKCSIINLNPLTKRIHKYLNNGLFRVLPVYQTCHMSTVYIFPTAEKRRAELNLTDGF